jgi:ribose transport system permease protein
MKHEIAPLGTLLRRLRGNAYFTLGTLIVVLGAVGEIVNPGFISFVNVGSILSIGSILTIVAVAQAVVIIAGGEGINLSMGATMSMGALLGASFMTQSILSIPVAIGVLLVAALIIGVVSGVGIEKFGIPPLIMTLIMASVISGFTLAYTRGLPTGQIPKALTSIGRPFWGPVSWILVIAVLTVILGSYILNRTTHGKRIFLVGANRRAALLSGINVSRNVISIYIVSSMMGALIGLLYLGYVGTAILNMANDYTLLSVAAVIIGGTKLAGGQGSLLGAALGALALTLLTNLLLSIGMPAGVREFIQGAVLLAILIANTRGPRLRQ